jgi:acid phosphatase
VPFDELERAMRSKRLPRFIFITPNTCNDAHDCPLDTADGFLADVVPDLIAAMGKRSVVIVTFDEGGTEEGCCGVAAGGHIATVVAGSGAVQGGRTNEPLTNYSILRTVEESFDLPLLGEAACPCTGTLSTLLRRH